MTTTFQTVAQLEQYVKIHPFVLYPIEVKKIRERLQRIANRQQLIERLAASFNN